MIGRRTFLLMSFVVCLLFSRSSLSMLLSFSSNFTLTMEVLKVLTIKILRCLEWFSIILLYYGVFGILFHFFRDNFLF